MASQEPTRWMQWMRPQDIIMLALFAAMAAASPTLDVSEGLLLFVLAALQIAGPKVPVFRSPRGKVLWILLELIFAYLLIGLTEGITSNYYLILLLPMISAATYLGVVGTLLFTVLSCGSYISFVLFVDFSKYSIDPDQVRVLAMRLIFLAVAGSLVNVLAEAMRVQAANYRKAAEKLEEANRSLSEAEAAVRRSERLAALGQLSAGLAHELRNPLGTMKASAEMLARSVAAENEVAREVAGFISTEVDRTNSLVTRFLEFARPLKLRLAPADLAEVLDRAVTLVERDAPQYGVTVYKNYSPDLPPFPLDAELMERVFYNLLLNAAQSSAAGGAITVKTRRLDGTAEVAVIDRGSGIDPKIREQIFNPFFTTKPEGSGLGLAIVSKIVDEHGGRMAVESEPGKGSVFRVYLPTRSRT
ncbi:MAG TPA: ATP-binding protein [Bryobacterales bacterium]|nr:ATP-binding protein [Bryobacterales bacterium]